jgi:hypothetical protein
MGAGTGPVAGNKRVTSCPPRVRRFPARRSFVARWILRRLRFPAWALRPPALLPTIGCVDRSGKPPASKDAPNVRDFLVCPSVPQAAFNSSLVGPDLLQLSEYATLPASHFPAPKYPALTFRSTWKADATTWNGSHSTVAEFARTQADPGHDGFCTLASSATADTWG